MNSDLNTVLDAAMKLPPAQRQELIAKLSSFPAPTKKPGNIRKYFGMVNSGDPNSADNDKIDADLASAYADNHVPED
ncbi:MAG: hypothetical protein ACKVRN_12930 [Pyrinomonadaceae bacterium]